MAKRSVDIDKIIEQCKYYKCVIDSDVAQQVVRQVVAPEVQEDIAQEEQQHSCSSTNDNNSLYHYFLKIDDEDDVLVEDDDIDDNILMAKSVMHIVNCNIMMSSIILSNLANNNRSFPREKSLFTQRLDWEDFLKKHGSRANFTRHMRMTKDTFYEILSFIRNDLEVDDKMANIRGGQIIPEICLYVCIRFIAGGAFSDIQFFTGISKSSTYRIIWKCIHAINNCRQLMLHFPQSTDEVVAAAAGFQSVSRHGCIKNCVSVIDGYHLEIITPSKEEVKNVRSFFSGHYQSYGCNVQAACDHNSIFTYIGVDGPGVMGDRNAIHQGSLAKLCENLPGLYCVIGDCAYTATEHVVPIYRGELSKRNKKYDNFNFFASQCRIRIEMAFGMMVKKWAILQKPLAIKFRNIKHLVLAIARLHNHCIRARLLRNSQRNNRSRTDIFQTPQSVELSPYDVFLRETAAQNEFDEMLVHEEGRSFNRERMATEIQSFGFTRPTISTSSQGNSFI